MEVAMVRKIPKVLMVTLLLSGGVAGWIRCSLEKPSAPSWDVHLEIPLLNKHYTMVDLSEDYDELDIQDDDVIFTIEQDLETFQVGDQLRVSGVHYETPLLFGQVNDDSVIVPLSPVVAEQAVIKSGSATLTINNPNNYPIQFVLELTDLFQSFDPPFFWQGDVPANDSRSFSIDNLEGYIFTPPVHGGRNYVRFSAQLSGGDPGDQVQAVLDVSDLTFRSLTGVLNQMSLDLEEVEEEIDIPEQLRDFQIAAADLRLVLRSGLLFPLETDILMEVLESVNGPTPVLSLNETLVPGGSGSDTLYVGDVSDFVNSLPTRIRLSGSLVLGDGTVSDQITDTTTVRGSALFQAPLTMQLPSDSTEMEVDTLDIDEDGRERIRDNLMELHLVADVENHLPVGASMRIYFSRNISVYQFPELVLEADLDPAPTEGSPGVVTQAASSHIDMLLTKEDLTLFEHPDVYVGIRLYFPGTAGEMVRVRPSDYIHINSYLFADIRADFPEDEEEGGES
jgi:hypothetical protein